MEKRRGWRPNRGEDHPTKETEEGAATQAGGDPQRGGVRGAQ